MQNHNKLRSFARRIGKSLSTTQKELIEKILPKYKFDDQEINNFTNSIINLEIGIGMAEHFVHMAKNNPSEIFIGCEPYLNGVANALKLSQENNVDNIKLFPDDADLILEKLPKNYVNKIYILFPDPWPKSRQNKRRFLNSERLKILINILKVDGEIVFASDIDDYFDDILNILKNSELTNISKSNFAPHDGYLKTKYNIKAEFEGRESRFLIFKK